MTHGGRFWEVQQWMPGQADFHVNPAKGKIEAACTALARLHTAWWRLDWADEGACPGIVRRTNVVDEWRRTLANGWRPLDWIDADDPVRPAAERALQHLPSLIEQAAGQLRAELGSRLLQPCMRDPWHDHFLFDGDRLVGLIDYGAVQVDATAVDLARALGSLVPDDGKAWERGLAAYRAVRAFSHGDEALAHCLDRTGVTLSAASWLLRLYHHGEVVEDRAGVARRLERMVERMEHWRGI